MLEFRKINRSPARSGRSVDGFVSRNAPLSPSDQNQPQLVNKNIDGIHSQQDSFTSKNQLDNNFTKALENRAALPMSPSIDSRESGYKLHKKRLNPRTWLGLVGKTTGVLVICGLIFGGLMFGKAWLTAQKIFQGGGQSSVLFGTDIKPETLKGEGDGRVNILLLGIGGGDRAGANLTDSIVIASIDPIAKDVALLSVPRDLWVDVPDLWTMKINAAYSSGLERSLNNGSDGRDAVNAGFTVLENTIEKYIGIPIHYHALVDFQGFSRGVDAVGGIDVQVEEDLYDEILASDNDGSPLIARAGLQHFDGRHALLYAQSRYSSSDFARGQRQRQVLISLKDKVLQTGTFSNPNTVSKLMDALGDNVSVNATLGEIMRMYEITKDIPSTSIATVGLTDEPTPLVTTGTVNDQSVVMPKAGIDDYSEILSFVRNTLRDPFLKSENATIAILNGTQTPGIATAKAEELKGYGYNVIIVDDAPTKDYATTVIYDRTNGAKKFTRNYLEKRLDATVSDEPSSTNPILATADFIVVLGQNEITQSTN